MKTIKILLGVLVASMLLTSCSNSEDLVIDPVNLTEQSLTEEQSLKSVDKRKATMEFIDLMNNSNFNRTTMEMLKKQPSSLSMSSVLEKSSSFVEDKESYKSLASKTAILEQKTSKQNVLEKVEVLEIWISNKQETTDFSNVLYSFAPEGKESEWTAIEAYTADKELVYLDPNEAPNVPVIVIETDGQEALKKEVDYMNKYLQDKGLQDKGIQDIGLSKNSETQGKSRKASGYKTRLDKIRLNNDREPWIRGKAEVYAVISGLDKYGKRAKGKVKVLAMDYLDHDKRDYHPKQTLIDWNQYKHNEAVVVFYEKDDNRSYKLIVAGIAELVIRVTLTIAGVPSILVDIFAGLVILMPDKWFTNNDDHIDSFYKIRRGQAYTNAYGSKRNARITLSSQLHLGFDF